MHTTIKLLLLFYCNVIIIYNDLVYVLTIFFKELETILRQPLN